MPQKARRNQHQNHCVDNKSSKKTRAKLRFSRKNDVFRVNRHYRLHTAIMMLIFTHLNSGAGFYEILIRVKIFTYVTPNLELS